MVDSYPPVPSRRFAYDDDGSVAFYCAGSGPNAAEYLAEATGGELALLNNQDTDVFNPPGSGPSGSWGFWFMFPELRELDGVFFAATDVSGAATSGMIATAGAAATNPFAGWSQSIAAGSMPDINAIPRDNYRDQIVSMAETSERGLAAIVGGTGSSRSLQQVHIYGTISPGETPDKILIIDDATGLEFTAALDLGDVPRGSSEDYGIRFRNDSASLTVNTVQYTVEALGVDGGGGYGGGNGWFTATLPGGSTYQGTRQIASIAAATTTALIKLRRITPGGEETRLFAPRLQVTHDSFT